MEIRDVLRKNGIRLDLKSTAKDTVIKELVQVLVDDGVVAADQQEAFEKVIWDREALGSTGVGEQIAIPHGMSELVKKPTVVFGRSAQGIDYDSLDGQPAYLFFLIATPKSSDNEHLKILSSLSTQLMKESVKQALFAAKTPEDVIAAFTNDETITPQAVIHDESKPLILAVTGCATGIAHTYMAAEKLQEAALAKGFNVKVETNGSSGVENKLSAAEIAKASGIIVAADIKVDMDRFDGKPVIQVPVAQGISKAPELVDKIANGNAHIFKGSNDEASTSTSQSGAKGVYQHLLNGVSHMLPFVIGGGIMIAIAFLVDQILGVPTDALDKLGSYNKLAGYFNTVGGTAFGFMLPVLAGYIASSIADRPGLVVGFVAGGIASAGGAGFLGALLGGFIAGYIMNALKKVLHPLPHSLNGIRTILLYPVLGVLIVGAIMLLVNIPMSNINTALNNFLNGLSGTNAVVLGLLLGAMMAIDLGGPINKAAYVFGTGTLAAAAATGGSSVMAAVMAAGMVPPLAIFFATLFFGNRFTKDEREAGITNLILGASFITEGAIPFASADPVRMLVSFVIGSAATGAAVLGLGIKVLAPHGGIFVIFLVSNPLMYLVFIIAGSLLSAAIIGILKKPLHKV